MARPRSECRDRAYQIWRDSGGKIKLKDLAAQLGVPDNRIRKWKAEDKWELKLKGALLNNEKGSAPKRRGAPLGNRNSVGHGAPKGNKNALGNNGGAPKGNKNAEKHGFFSKIFPDDPETQEIIEEIQVKSPLEILWEQIVIQYTAIARAQRIMFVQDKEDLTQYLKRERRGENPEKEWEFQYAWDKHGNFLQAQSRAITTLERLIARYEALLLRDLETEEQKLRIETLKVQLAKIKNPNPDADLSGYIEALKSAAEEAWAEGEGADKE